MVTESKRQLGGRPSGRVGLNVMLLVAMSVGGAAATAFADASSNTTAAELPRYRLKVGQELVYEQTADEDLLSKTGKEKSSENIYETKLKWWVWVTKQNDDGSWRLLIRKRINSFVTKPGGQPEKRFENDILGYCDLAPDGSFGANSSIGGHSYFKPFPSELFVGLPSSQQALSDGWKYTSPIDEAERSFKITNRDDDILQFAGSVVTLTARNYQSQQTSQIDFDLRRGVVVAKVDESKAEWSVNPWHSRHTISLISAGERDAKWIESLAREAD